ncbi:MAG: hypothetical protein KF767_14845 [Bdellovibrionaceae bacterium]|nr:hypothetical protein [Pseudobdellovibrionaceae bacterium]
MYEPLLFIHSWVRWVVLFAGLYLVVRYSLAARANRPWNGGDQHLLWAFDQSFGYQFLFGLTLWAGMSPWTKAFFQDPVGSLENPFVFFWSLRHPLTMFVAIGVFHMMKAKARRLEGAARFKKLAVTIALTLVIVLSAIPWPWMDVGRAWIRGLS